MWTLVITKIVITNNKIASCLIIDVLKRPKEVKSFGTLKICYGCFLNPLRLKMCGV